MAPIRIREISSIRFGAFVAYARSPEVTLLADEIAWFEVGDAAIFVTLLVDTDQEFSAIVFAADLAGKYRWVNQTTFSKSAESALAELPTLVEKVMEDLDRARVQGDERDSVDFFTPVVAESALNPLFKQLVESSGWSPAQQLIEIMMRWYENQDGNYVQKFQSDAFDSRLWELYIFAVLVEAGFRVSQPIPAPDFAATRFGNSIHVEATTLNPSLQGGARQPSSLPTDPEERVEYVENYLPIRFARSLTAKLRRAYWEDPLWTDDPFLMAIQDFHDHYSMTFSVEALKRYLYAAGDRVDALSVHDAILEHVWGDIREPSGFFAIEGAEHVSAVAFNPSGTLAKFNRMGIAAGLGSGGYMIHKGVEFDAELGDWAEFVRTVEPDYPERWIDGMQVFHNPRALHPLDPQLLLGAAHVRFVDGRFEEWIPNGHLLVSTNVIVNTVADSGDE